MTAQVVRGDTAKYACAAGYPTVLWKDRAEMECGCAVLVGIRLDTQEPSLVFCTCDAGSHHDVMAQARELYVESLLAPRAGVEAVAVACEVLCSAFNRPGGC